MSSSSLEVGSTEPIRAGGPEPDSGPRPHAPIVRLAAAVTIAIGALALVGWQEKLVALKSITRDLPNIEPNTAVALVVAGVALLLLERRPPAAIRRWPAIACGLAILLLGLATLGEYLFGSIGIDKLMFHPTG